MVWLVAAVFMMQVVWTVNAYCYDWVNRYSASRAAAGFITSHLAAGQTINAAGFSSIAILPYFNRNIFANYNGGGPRACWLWSTRNNLFRRPEPVQNRGADWLVIGIKDRVRQKVPKVPGYRELRYFKGGIFWKDQVFEPDSYLIMVRNTEVDN
jgi:hypothetical protein